MTTWCTQPVLDAMLATKTSNVVGVGNRRVVSGPLVMEYGDPNSVFCEFKNTDTSGLGKASIILTGVNAA